MTILEAARLMRSGKTTSVELTRECLDRIKRLQPRLNAFLTITAETAIDRARLMDQELAAGFDRGPLHGIPIALKDVFCTKGVRTTCGSILFADHVPVYDAAVAERLDEAGAVLLGKTNMHELAYGITSTNPHFGPVRNPWQPEHVPGGSSGGSGAAVAAGLAFMAMGSDTGGSIRIPASFCGTVGLKPTIGRVSRRGVMPLDFTLDHMGPLTRTVRDAAVTLNAIAGHDPRDESSSREPVEDYLPAADVSLRGLRIGVPENFYFEQADVEVARAVRSTIALAGDLGAATIPVTVPDIAAINTVGRIILLVEASAVMEVHLSNRAQFGEDVLALLDQGRLIPATDYVQAQRLRRLAQEEFRELWKIVDCLAMPTTPSPAPRIGESTATVGGLTEDVRLAATRLVRAFNVLGLPALSMPCGFGRGNLPLGLQIVGPPFREKRILRVGAALEDALPAVPDPPVISL